VQLTPLHYGHTLEQRPLQHCCTPHLPPRAPNPAPCTLTIPSNCTHILSRYNSGTTAAQPSYCQCNKTTIITSVFQTPHPPRNHHHPLLTNNTSASINSLIFTSIVAFHPAFISVPLKHHRSSSTTSPPAPDWSSRNSPPSAPDAGSFVPLPPQPPTSRRTARHFIAGNSNLQSSMGEFACVCV